MKDRLHSGNAPSAPMLNDARFQAFFDHSPTFWAMIDSDGVIQDVNFHGASKLGYDKGDLAGNPVLPHLHEEDRRAFGEQLAITRTTPGTVASRDLRLLRKDQRPVWVRASARSVPDQRAEATILLVCKDLTEEKRSKARLLADQARLRILTMELRLAEEKERRRIAAGLHDDVGHSLALARIKLASARKGDPPVTEEVLDSVCRLIDEAIKATRSLTFELSSPVLYELGLEAALESLGERVIENNGINFVFTTDQEPRPLSLNAKVVLYRSAEEILLNALKHSRARSVHLAVTTVEDRMEICIEDDGVGFIVPDGKPAATSGHRFGLLSVDAQLQAIGGQLQVSTAVARGTTARIVAPLGTPR